MSATTVSDVATVAALVFAALIFASAWITRD